MSSAWFGAIRRFDRRSKLLRGTVLVLSCGGGAPITAIEQDGYFNWVEDVANGVMEAADAVELFVGVAAAEVTGGLSAVAAAVRAQYYFVVGLFVDNVVVPEVKNFAIRQMASAAEVSDWANPNSTAEHGLRLMVTKSPSGAQAYFVEAWDPPNAEGPKGSMGIVLRYNKNDYGEAGR